MSEPNPGDTQAGHDHTVVSVLVSIVVIGLASYGMIEITGFREWWDSILVEKGLK